MVTVLPASTTHEVMMPPTDVQLPPGAETDTVPNEFEGLLFTDTVTCTRANVATHVTSALTVRSMTVGVPGKVSVQLVPDQPLNVKNALAGVGVSATLVPVSTVQGLPPAQGLVAVMVPEPAVAGLKVTES
jgi:hypothetical protein